MSDGELSDSDSDSISIPMLHTEKVDVHNTNRRSKKLSDEDQWSKTQSSTSRECVSRS